MGSLTALLLATPIFGFSLQAPALEQSLEVSAKMVTELRAADAAETTCTPGSQADYVADTKLRNNIASIHRTMGIATWVSMTLTVAAGFMAYYNLYGFGAGIGDNPCVTGKAIGGDCSTMRVVKNTLAIATTALYATTFTLALAMPDPDRLSEGKGEFASTLRLHKALRWVHFAGMVAQAVIGIVIANSLVGLDRANDYGTMQALATAHLGIGLVTWGALTWAGALMVF